MKKNIYILVFLYSMFLTTNAQEQDSILSAVDTLSLDTLDILPAEPLEFTQTKFDQRWMEYTLSWLDTTLCDAPQDTTTLPDSVYIARLKSLPYIIEMPYNNIVRGFIDMYVRRRPKQVARLLRLSEYYFPLFEEALCKYNLPDELKYLPVIESGLNASAHSHMGAAGLWQFMPRTGKNCGLEVNSLVDERLDPIKATDAACRFLNSLYAIYGDWNLVIASYNCGPGNVNKAIHRSGGKRDFWDIYPYLPRETRSYLPIFIAANYAMNFATQHNICPAQADYAMATDTILTNKRLHLLQVAEITGAKIEELRRLNPQYKMDILPGGKTYALCLPQEITSAFIQHEDTIYLHRADTLINSRRAVIDMAQKTAIDGSYSVNGITYYKVKSGDTLGAIAKKYHCSVKQLQRWNNLGNSTNIRINQKLKILR